MSAFKKGVIAVAIMGALAFPMVSVAQQAQQSQAERRIQMAESIAQDIRSIQEAIYTYMDIHKLNSYASVSHPTFLQELVAQGLYSGSMTSPMGTIYSTRVVGESIEVVVNTTDAQYARTTSSLVPNGAVSGSTSVASRIGLPSQTEAYQQLVGRYNDPARGYRQDFTLGAELGMSGHDLVNTREIQAQVIDGTDITAESTETNQVQARQSLTIGGAQITESGGQLNIGAANTEIDTALIDLEGNLTGNGGGASGIHGLGTETLTAEHIDGVSVDTDRLTAREANLERLETRDLDGTMLNVTSGQATQLSAGHIETQTATLGELSGQSIKTTGAATGGSVTSSSVSALSGQIDNISGETVNTTTADIGELDTGILTATTGLVASASGALVQSGNADIATANAVAIDSNNADIQNVQGQHASAASAQFNVLDGGAGDISNVNTSSATAQQGHVSNRVTASSVQISDTLSGDSLQSSGTIDVTNDVRVSGAANISSIYANTADIASATGGTASAGFVYTENLQTATIQSNQSEVGVASASSASFSGGISANTANVSGTGTFTGNVNSTSMAGQSLTIAGEAKAGTLNASGNVTTNVLAASNDVHSSKSSINANYTEMQALKGDLDNCMNTTQYCYPQEPRPSPIQCHPNAELWCEQEGPKENFTAQLSTSVSDCRHGCTYSWSIPSGFSVHSGCASGTVPEGSASNNLVCQIKNTNALGRQEDISGTVTFNVHSTRNPDLSDTLTKGVYFKNNRPDDPFEGLEWGVNCSGDCTQSRDAGVPLNLSFTSWFIPPEGYHESEYTINRHFSWQDVPGAAPAGCSATHGKNGGTLNAAQTAKVDCAGQAVIRASHPDDPNSLIVPRAKRQYMSITYNAPTAPFNGGVSTSCSGFMDGNRCEVRGGWGSSGGVSGQLSLDVSINYPVSHYTMTTSAGFVDIGFCNLSKGESGTGVTYSMHASATRSCSVNISYEVTHLDTGQKQSGNYIFDVSDDEIE